MLSDFSGHPGQPVPLTAMSKLGARMPPGLDIWAELLKQKLVSIYNWVSTDSTVQMQEALTPGV